MPELRRRRSYRYGPISGKAAIPLPGLRRGWRRRDHSAYPSDGPDFAARGLETATGEPPPKDSGKKPSCAKAPSKLWQAIKTYDYTDEIGEHDFSGLCAMSRRTLGSAGPIPDISGRVDSM